MVEFRSPIMDDKFHRRREYKSVYREIAERPGQFGVIAKYDGSDDPREDQKRRKVADVRASDIRRGNVKEAAQYGQWETVVQKHPATGQWELFARLIRTGVSHDR